MGGGKQHIQLKRKGEDGDERSSRRMVVWSAGQPEPMETAG